MKTWMILNPTAGSGEGRQALRNMAAKRSIKVYETQDAGDARRRAARATAQGVHTVIAAGGDGTISDVINGLSADFEACRVAIVPMGTANDFARTLGIPTDNAAAMSLLDEGGHRERRVDLIRTDCEEGRIIINASTGGFSQLVHEHLDEQTKARWGVLAYLRAGLEAMPEVCYSDTTLIIDGEEVATPSCAIIVANGRSAGGMPLAPEADVEDQRLDLLVVRGQEVMDRLRLASKLAVGDHLQDEALLFRRAREVRIEAEPAMNFSSDGDLIGHTPITFAVVPQALRMLVPFNEPHTK